MTSALGLGSAGGIGREIPAEGGPERTVLYIEDSEWNVELVQRIFRMTPDLRLLVATTATEAVERASRERCDLILTDLNLPDLSGDVLLATLREHPATGHLRIVVVTGDDAAGLDERLRAAGAFAVLGKPYTIDDLVGTVRRALGAEPATAPVEVAPARPDRGESLFDRLRRMGADDQEDMVARFLAASSAEMAEMRRSLDAGDTEHVQYLAHRLQGSLALFGAAAAAEHMQELAQLDASAMRDGAEVPLTAAQRALERYVAGLGTSPRRVG